MALGRLSVIKSADYLNQSSATFDNNLKRLLEAASAVVERYTGRTLVSATQTDEVHTGNDTKYLWPNVWPVASVSAVKIWDGVSTFATITAGHYEIIEERKIKYPKLGQETSATYGAWPSRYEDGIKITYVAGYVDTAWATDAITVDWTVPRDLEQAVCELAALMWEEGKAGQGRRGFSVISKSQEAMTIEKFVRGLPPGVKLILDNYRDVAGAFI